MAGSGSPWTILAKQYFAEKFCDVKTQDDPKESDIVAQRFDGSTINMRGYTEVVRTFKGREAHIKLYVGEKGVNVLGWRDQWKLGIILNPCNKELALVVNKPESFAWLISVF